MWWLPPYDNFMFSLTINNIVTAAEICVMDVIDMGVTLMNKLHVEYSQDLLPKSK